MYSRWYWLAIHLLVITSLTELLKADDDSFQSDDLLRRIRSAPRVKRIIGGSLISNGQWKWLVNLKGEIPASSWGWLTTSYNYYYCGGSLISSRWVLTAAHCFAAPGAPSGVTNPSNWNIKAGDVKRTVTGVMDTLRKWWYSITNQQTANWFYLSATKIILHPKYDPNNMWLNDLALVKLEQDLPLYPVDPYIDVVALPGLTGYDDWPPEGANCSMQGWGCTVEGGPLQDYARGVDMPVLSNNTCTGVFGDLGPYRFCAGYNLAQKGICKGDSGGPLVCLDGTTWRQAGIASFASGENSGNWPGGFTRVSKYVAWIQAVIKVN